MANNTDRIDEIVAEQAFKQVTTLTENLTILEKKFIETAKAADGANASIGNVKGLKELQEQVSQLALRNKELDKIYKDLEITEAKKNAAESQQAKLLAQEKILLQEKNAALKAEAKETLASTGSLEQKRLTLNRLLKEYDKLGDVEKKNVNSEQLLKNIQKLDAEVKKLEADTGRFGKNVGNYNSVWEGFKEKGIGALTSVDNGFKNLGKSIAATAASFIGIQGLFSFGEASIESFQTMKLQSERLELSFKNLGATDKDIMQLKNQLGELKKSYNFLNVTDIRAAQEKLVTYGKLSTQQIKALTPTIVDFASKTKQSLNDATDDIIKGLEGRNRGFVNYGLNLSKTNTTTQNFNEIQTTLAEKIKESAALFAETAEGKAEAYKRKLGEIKVTIGEQLIPAYQNFLEYSTKILSAFKDSGLSLSEVIKWLGIAAAAWAIYRIAVAATSVAQYISTSAMIANKVVTEGVTVATIANTTAETVAGKTMIANTLLTNIIIAAKKLWAFATRVTTIEIGLLNTAIKISPLGIFLTIVGLAVTLFSSLSASAGNTANAFEKMNRSQKELNEAQVEGAKNAAVEIASLDKLYASATNTALGIDAQKKAALELQKTYPVTFANFTVEEIMLGKAKQGYEDLAKSILAVAVVKAKQTLIDKSAVNYAEEDQKLSQKIEDAKKAVLDAPEKKRNVDDKIVFYTYPKAEAEAYLSSLENDRIKLKQQYELKNSDFANSIAEDKKNSELANKNEAERIKRENAALLKKQKSENEDDNKTTKPKKDASLQALKDKQNTLFEREKIDAQRRIKLQEEILSSDENSYDARLKALNAFSTEKININKKETDEKTTDATRKYYLEDARLVEEEAGKSAKQKARIEANRKIVEQNYTQQILLIKKIGADKELQIFDENQKKFEEIGKSDLAKKIKNLQDASAKEKAAISTEEAVKLTQLEDGYNRGKVKLKDYEQAKLDIQNEYSLKRLEAELKIAEALLEIANENEQDTAKQEEVVANIRLKIAEQVNKKTIDADKQALEKKKELAQQEKALWKELYTELGNTVKQFFDNGIERQKKALEKQKTNIDEQRDAELKRINLLNISEADKADKIKILDANVQAQKEAIAKRQKQLDIQKAKAEKVINAFEVGLNTTKNVAILLGDAAKAKAQAAVLLSNPLTATYAPIALANAAAIGVIAGLTAAIGAAQLAQIISRPIPEYYTGTKDSGDAGFAWIGERGKELGKTKDGKYFETPSTPTLAYLPANTEIINNQDYMKMLSSERSNSTLQMPMVSIVNSNKIQMQQFTDQVVNAIKNQPKVVNNISSLGITEMEKRGNSWNNYIDKQVRFK